MITRNALILKDGLTGELVRGAVEEHYRALPRLEKLRRYYLGENEVLSRRRQAGLPNNRIAHPFARYISTVTSGALTGKPVEYKGESGTLPAIKELLKRAGAQTVDVENARSAAIYGRGVEMLFCGGGGEVKIYALPPEAAFTVYDDTIAHKPLFGVCICGKLESGEMSVAAADSVRTVLFNVKDGAYVKTGECENFFGGVPIIEYWNDENERGDFEWVIPLIDAYDALQSDRVNDKDQFADKLLVLTGCTLETDEEGRPPWLQLRMDKALCLPDGEARAQYLSAQMDENGNEILRQSLENDIHKLALVPDISDINFSGNSSGVALKYKLLGLRQLTRMKQRWFEEGLRERLRLICNLMQMRGYPDAKPEDIEIKFADCEFGDE